MARVGRFEDLEVWKTARDFCQDVFRITNYEAFAKNYSLKDQLRSSSGSVMDNIAEGFERNGNKEFIQFLFIAKGSCGESRSQLYRAFDYRHIDQAEFELLCLKTENISKALSNFIKYLKQSELTGIKYKI